MQHMLSHLNHFKSLKGNTTPSILITNHFKNRLIVFWHTPFKSPTHM